MKVKYVINGKSMSKEEFLEGGNGIQEILESRQFPGLQTDDEFMARRGTLADQLGEQTNDVVRAAQRHGYNPSYNDVYLSSVARFPGDPEAFVGHDSARGKIKKTLEKRGWGCDGSVKLKSRETEPPKSVGLADDLVCEEVKSLTLRDSKARKAGLRELKQHVIQKHGKK